MIPTRNQFSVVKDSSTHDDENPVIAAVSVAHDAGDAAMLMVMPMS